MHTQRVSQSDSWSQSDHTQVTLMCIPTWVFSHTHSSTQANGTNQQSSSDGGDLTAHDTPHPLPFCRLLPQPCVHKLASMNPSPTLHTKPYAPVQTPAQPPPAPPPLQSGGRPGGEPLTGGTQAPAGSHAPGVHCCCFWVQCWGRSVGGAALGAVLVRGAAFVTDRNSIATFSV